MSTLTDLEQLAAHALQRAFASRDEVKRAKEKLVKLEDEYYHLTLAARTAAQALAAAVVREDRYIALVGSAAGIGEHGLALSYEYTSERPS